MLVREKVVLDWLYCCLHVRLLSAVCCLLSAVCCLLFEQTDNGGRRDGRPNTGLALRPPMPDWGGTAVFRLVLL